MGGACSSSIVQPAERTLENEQIDRLLEESAAREELHFKILCLGAGESGKSTIVKQLTFIHKQQVSREERLSYIKVLQNNTLQCMITLIKECEGFGYHFTESERQSADAICAHDQRNAMPYELGADIHALWASAPIQATYARRNEFWHLETTEYYFQNVDRYTSESFVPSEEDIVMARKRTTGVVVTELDYGGIHWSCVDVGGQRSERRKWLNCFDNVKAIIYVVNLAGYCKVLFEDKAVNRMHESLNLFEATLSNPLFAATPVFIFLNKKDLFEQLIREKSIDCCFPEYTGPNDLHSSVEYITEEYSRRLPPHSPKPTFLLLAARMKKDVQYCFEEVKDILLEHHKKGISKAKKALERVEKRNATNPSEEVAVDNSRKVRGLQGWEWAQKKNGDENNNQSNNQTNNQTINQSTSQSKATTPLLATSSIASSDGVDQTIKPSSDQTNLNSTPVINHGRQMSYAQNGEPEDLSGRSMAVSVDHNQSINQSNTLSNNPLLPIQSNNQSTNNHLNRSESHDEPSVLHQSINQSINQSVYPSTVVAQHSPAHQTAAASPYFSSTEQSSSHQSNNQPNGKPASPRELDLQHHPSNAQSRNKSNKEREESKDMVSQSLDQSIADDRSPLILTKHSSHSEFGD